MSYLEVLQELYFQQLDIMARVSSAYPKKSMVVDKVFDLTTYDTSIDSVLYDKCMMVADAVSDATTFDLVNSDSYIDYIAVINLPFFINRVGWGCSIRSAWWNQYSNEFKFELRSIYADDDTGFVITTTEEMVEFLKAIREFVGEG